MGDEAASALVPDVGALDRRTLGVRKQSVVHRFEDAGCGPAAEGLVHCAPGKKALGQQAQCVRPRSVRYDFFAPSQSADCGVVSRGSGGPTSI